MKNAFKSVVVSLLMAEARLALAVHRPKIVAVTGNLGKTTTKDAIFAAVSGAYAARKSQKSFNSEIGVPLTILGLENPWSSPIKWLWTLVAGLFAAISPSYPKLLVLEVGADTPGDISSIANWLRPDIAVYTGVPEIPVHVAQFGSREGLVEEKRSLLKHVRRGGAAVVSGADVQEATIGVGCKVVTYGFDAAYDVSASKVRIESDASGPVGMAADAIVDQDRYELRVNGALGKPFIFAALAALAVARELRIDASAAVHAICAWRTAPGRMRILQGINGSRVIDDSYNSSPAAALSALETLAEVPATRRIAVLGDMRELGKLSEKAHREVGVFAARVVDKLVTVGEESRTLAQAARTAGLRPDAIREYGYDSSEQAGKDLATDIRAGDVILIKGSQNRIRVEKVARALLDDPSQASQLLVRHDSEWLAKP